MAPDRKAPVFLARGSYRQRRLRDVSRVLPLAGAILFALPLLWTDAGTGDAAAPPRTSEVVIYILIVWAGLILAAAVLARLVRPDADDPDAAEADAAGAGSAPAAETDGRPGSGLVRGPGSEPGSGPA